MELPINRDPQQLNRSAFAGRKRWQWVCIITAIAIAVIFTVITTGKINPTLNGLICIILVAPLGYIGIYKKNGLDFFEYRRKKKSGKTFLYITKPYYAKASINVAGTEGKKRSGFAKAKYILINIITGGKYVD